MTLSNTSPTILMVPGLRDHVAEHWQTLLEAKLQAAGHKAASVPPLEVDRLSCAARVAALDKAITAIDGPVILVAHSAGVMITVHWAKRHARKIHGALLATPADLETQLPSGYPTQDVLQKMAGCPARGARCRFRASSRPAGTIRWRRSSA
ncbi:RBBP9/YdeN family alpha/beta hydrolase [Ralstonia sp. L16]|uniref:RBBP9/YdeN family alpha/beta hydrolase n=1 Tax=Ralstonia sp. L16 TaxID=3423950 RepID=UPI003F79502E